MFNFVPKYILILKVFRKLSDEKNAVFRFFVKFFVFKNSDKNYVNKIDSLNFKTKLKDILGDFDDFGYQNLSENDKTKIIRDAKNTLEHRFDILGSGLTQVNPIDWHTDFKSNFTWAKGRFYKKYKLVNPNNSADVKVCWDLSRCHHLLWLGEAYLLTSNEKYAKEVVFQIEDWIKENTLMRSINWTCAMDVAIRSINWLYALNMISSSQAISDTFARKVSTSLYEHGFFIYNNLEKSFPYSSNHYVANLTGLIFLGTFFSATTQGLKWKSFSTKEYFHEVRTQVLPSGVHYERSTSYHRLVTELFIYPYFMLLRIQEKVPIDVETNLKRMLLFVQNYSKPNGKAPLIGDNDNGRLLPFVEKEFYDHRYLLDLAGEFFKDGVSSMSANVDSFFGLNNVIRVEKEPFLNQNPSTKVYTDAGFAIMRKDDFYLFFKNEDYSKYADKTDKIIGTHTHADALSFVLSIGEDDFIVDPGSYCYSSSVTFRNEFRSTRKHNTIQVDDLNQIELIESNIFAVKGYKLPEKIHYAKVHEKETLSGAFYWDISPKESILHKRSIVSENKNELHVVDSINNSQPHNFILSYHFSDQVKVTHDKNVVLLETDSGMILKLDIEADVDFNITIEDDTISPSYGVIRKSKTMRLVCQTDQSFAVKTNFIYKTKSNL